MTDTTYPDLTRTTAGRWSRLAVDLTNAGYPAKVAEHRYPGGVSRRITLKVAGRHLIEIRDSYGRGDQWAGWQLWLEDADAIAVADRSRITRRWQVVDHVRVLAASVTR